MKRALAEYEESLKKEQNALTTSSVIARSKETRGQQDYVHDKQRAVSTYRTITTIAVRRVYLQL